MKPFVSPFNRFIDDHVEIDFGAQAKSNSAVICLATPGNEVIYVSDSFEYHTGYSPHEIIGRNLSFLQGPNTEQAAVEQFRNLIKNCLAGTVIITNYRKDGSQFKHECEFRPVLNDLGQATHFVAIQRPVCK